MQGQTRQALLDAFEMMWGGYHEPVRLIDRGFRVLAGNAAYLKTGGRIGGKCNAENPELHVGCRAMECLKEQRTTRKTSELFGVRWDSFWVPVKGHEDCFIHFTNGMNEFIERMAQENESR